MLLALLGDAENLSKLQSLVGFAKMDCDQQSPTTAQSPDTPAKAKQEPKSGPRPKVGVLLLCLPQVPLCCGVPQLLSGMTVGWRYPSEAAQGAAVSRSLSPSPSLSHPSLQGDCSSLLSSSVFSSWVRLFPPRTKTHQFEFVAISLLTILRGTHHFVCGLCFSSGRA